MLLFVLTWPVGGDIKPLLYLQYESNKAHPSDTRLHYMTTHKWDEINQKLYKKNKIQIYKILFLSGPRYKNWKYIRQNINL